QFVQQSLDAAQLVQHFLRAGGVTHLDLAAEIEPLHYLVHVAVAVEIFVVGASDGGANDLAHHVVGALQFAFVFQFEFAGHRGQGGINVANARDHQLLARANRPPLGIGDDVFRGADGQPLAHSGALIDALIFASDESNLLDYLAHEFWNLQLQAIARRPRFLRGDGNAFFDGRRIVRADLRADAVLQRRNDFAARGVILRVGAEDQGHVERHTHRVALNLHIAFLHDVEQTNLDLAREIRQLVDGEDAAIGARQQSVVDRVLATQFVAALGRLDGVDVADQVGDGDVGGRQLFHVTIGRRQVRNGRVIRVVGQQFAAAPANRRVRIVVDFAAAQVRHMRIKQAGKRAQDAAFRLPAQSEKNKI